MTSAATDEAAVNALADSLFAQLRQGDYDAAAACFAPNATWLINGILHGSVTEILTERKKRPHALGPHTHEEIRRVFGAGAFVEQHVNRWIGPDGKPKELFVCIVVSLDAESLVTRLEEYYDNAARQAAITASG